MFPRFSIVTISSVLAVLAAGAVQADVLKCVGSDKAPISVYLDRTGANSSDNVVFADPARPAGKRVLAHFRADKNEIGSYTAGEGLQLKNDIAKEQGDLSINESDTFMGHPMRELNDFHLQVSEDGSTAYLRADLRAEHTVAEPAFTQLTCSVKFKTNPADPEWLHEYANGEAQ